MLSLREWGVEARKPTSGTSTANLADQQTRPLDTKLWTPFGGQQHAPPYPGAPYQGGILELRTNSHTDRT